MEHSPEVWHIPPGTPCIRFISQTEHLYEEYQEPVQLSRYSDKVTEWMNEDSGSNVGTGNRGVSLLRNMPPLQKVLGTLSHEGKRARYVKFTAHLSLVPVYEYVEQYLRYSINIVLN